MEFPSPRCSQRQPIQLQKQVEALAGENELLRSRLLLAEQELLIARQERDVRKLLQ